MFQPGGGGARNMKSMRLPSAAMAPMVPPPGSPSEIIGAILKVE